MARENRGFFKTLGSCNINEARFEDKFIWEKITLFKKIFLIFRIQRVNEKYFKKLENYL